MMFYITIDVLVGETRLYFYRVYFSTKTKAENKKIKGKKEAKGKQKVDTQNKTFLSIQVPPYPSAGRKTETHSASVPPFLSF